MHSFENCPVLNVDICPGLESRIHKALQKRVLVTIRFTSALPIEKKPLNGQELIFLE